MTITEAKTLIGAAGQGGKIFSVRFIKRTTGEVRHMVCRLGVRKQLKGVGLSFSSSRYNLMTVYDMQKQGYRMINLETVSEVKGHGKIWKQDRLAW